MSPRLDRVTANRLKDFDASATLAFGTVTTKNPKREHIVYIPKSQLDRNPTELRNEVKKTTPGDSNIIDEGYFFKDPEGISFSGKPNDVFDVPISQPPDGRARTLALAKRIFGRQTSVMEKPTTTR